jgi:capsular polysaccharide biosynthesis protein
MKRFNQPIYTMRLFSDSRLVFGAHGLGMSNPLFFVPLPRGCITVLLER